MASILEQLQKSKITKEEVLAAYEYLTHSIQGYDELIQEYNESIETLERSKSKSKEDQIESLKIILENLKEEHEEGINTLRSFLKKIQEFKQIFEDK